MIPPPSGSLERRSSRARIRARTLLVFAPACIALALSTIPAIAFGQGESSPEMMTEIWMSGTGVALWRRVPQDRRLARPQEDDQFAQSMLKVAQQRLDRGDRETAGWLARCAHGLSDGRIGPEGWTENLINGIDSRTCAAVASVTARRNPLPEGTVWPPIYVEFHSPASIPKNEGETARVEEPDLKTVPAVTEDNVDSIPSGEIGPSPTAGTPNESITEPIAIGLISFAAGAVFCVSLCAIWRLAPHRSAHPRRAESPSKVVQETAEPTVQVAEKRDNSSWVVEDFYNQNVELYGQLAQGG